MIGVNRLPEPFGALIDRNCTVPFRFEGRSYEGYSGDNIASALAANDQWLLSRSFKYHRPRGVLTMAGQDANTLVQVPSAPNALADRTPIVDGIDVRAQNYSGSLARDRDGMIGWLSRFLPVGFYYHAFYRPQGAWNLWSRYFRRKAGLGVIDTAFEATDYDKQYGFCDMLVVGGGPNGMRAAIDAAGRGEDVLLVDEQSMLGGSLNYIRQTVDSSAEADERDTLLAQVHAAGNITVMTGATVNGWYADNFISIISGKRLHKVRARNVMLCTGNLEQHALFHNNDLPGIMMGTAAQRLIKLYAVRPGNDAVVLAGNDDAYGVTLDLVDAGVNVRAVVDCRSNLSTDSRVAAVSGLGIEILSGHTVYAATRSGNHLSSVDIRRVLGKGQCGDDSRRLECDLLCMSVGFMPAYQLACQAGASLNYDDRNAIFSIQDLPDGVESVHDTRSGNYPWPIFPHPKGKEFVDFDEDLQLADIVNATLAGYEHIQLVKRYSTCGMGPSQGRHSALPAARIVADATGKTVAETGVTTARPPFTAETLAHVAGRRFYPALRSNIHHRHIEAGATMLQAGSWYRPAYYGADATAAIAQEVAAVRHSVGLIDVSTLGGINVHGSDAAEFLNRIYTFAYKKQQVATVRYALMTNAAGVVIDDGVVVRLDEEGFYVTATTGGAETVYRKMLQWNAEWQLDVTLINVTNAYAAVNIAGPLSRNVLASLCNGFDLDAASFPYLAMREGRVAGIPAMLLRVGFVGELGYEIHVPSHCGEALWDALYQAGQKYKIRPVGIEAQRMLRLEKGHIIVGQDTDAMSTPAELQMDWAVAKSKPFFVGKRSLEALHEKRPNRRLVGFSCDADGPLPREGHLIINKGRLLGRVTSSGVSPTIGRIIGLAYVPAELAKPGNTIEIGVDDGLVDATIEELPFYDSGGERQKL